ncbi:Ig-like domain-containing protein [Azospirillum agricola]|uniref:Ig-like domain-containing protein n=1 Tax=Azospirillum agricola TaxID=1720247 RepID=UPI000A0F266C|nr:Ig-like domain-containing protein [Azospirillum agricola]SMH61874.1 Ig-like domain (group 3) [Azospirillum lipoferum]
MAAGGTLTLAAGATDYIFAKGETWSGIKGLGTRGVTLQTQGITATVTNLDHINGGVNAPASGIKDVITLGGAGGNTITVRSLETLIGSGGYDRVTGTSIGSTMAVESIETFIGTTTGTHLIVLTSSAGNTMSVGYLKSIIGSAGKDVLDFGAAGALGTTTAVGSMETLIGTSSGMDLIATVANSSNTVQVSGIEIFLGSSTATFSDVVRLDSRGGTIGVGYVETLIGSAAADVAAMAFKTGSLDMKAGTGTLAVSSVETIVGGVGGRSAAVLLDVGTTVTVASLNTLIGGSGNDVVTMTLRDGTPVVGDLPIAWITTGSTMMVEALETVIGTAGEDALMALRNVDSTMSVRAIETIIGRAGNETVLLGAGGNTVKVAYLETLIGGSGNDVMSVTGASANSGMTTMVTSVETLIGGAGNDVVVLTETTGTVYVSGIDTIFVGGQAVDLGNADRLFVFPMALSAPSAPSLGAGSDSGTLGDSRTNATLPTLTGTAAAGSVVTLYGNGTALGSGTADGSGQWAVTATTALADGTWTMTAKTVASGMESAASGPLLLTIDTTAPTAPTLSYAPGSDSGRSASDGVTNVATPTVTGTAEAGSTVTLYLDGASVGTTTASGTGAWWITAPVVPEGGHTLTARAVDTAGNTSAASAGLAFTVDTTTAAPTGVALTAASDTGTLGDNLTAVTTPVIGGTAEANAVVSLYKDSSTLLGSATADGSGVWRITLGALAEGAHTLTARAVDLAGNGSTASTPLIVTIDTTPPVAPSAPSLTAASDSGSSSSDRLTNVRTPTFTGTAEANSVIDLLVSGSVVGTGTADGSGAWTVTAGSPLADGSWTFSTRSRDAAGNTRDGVGSLIVTIDSTADAPGGLKLTAATDSGRSSTDGLTNNLSPTVAGTAAAGGVVTLYDGAVALGTATANGQGNWEIATSGLSVGAHTLTAKAIDAAGNTSLPSAAFTVTVDTSAAAPTGLALAAASDSGVTGDSRTNLATPSVTGTAEASSIVLLYEGSTLLGQTTAGSDGGWTVTSSALTGAVHTLTAKAIDPAGNTSVASGGLAVTIDLTAPDAPGALFLSSDSGTPNDNRTRVGTPVITGTAEAGSTVRLYEGATLLGIGTADASTGVWTVTSSSLGEGAHTLTARAVDAAGNTGAASAAFAITIDQTSATPSGLALSGATNSGSTADTLTNALAPTITGTAEAGATITLYGGGSTATATADGSGHWSATITGLGEGDHTLTASAVDIAGNTSQMSAGLVISIDRTGPGLSTPTADTAGPSGQFTPILSGTAEANSVVTLYDGSSVGATVLGVATVDNTGLWSITTTELGGGTYTMTARALDAAGNETVTTTSLTVTGRIGVPGGLQLVSDSGVTGDGITNATSPTLTGTALAGATVSLYSGLTLMGSGTADGSGLWTIVSTGTLAADGTHTLQARIDAYGTVLTSSRLTVTIDTTAPDQPGALALQAGSDSGSVGNDRITNLEAVTVTGTAEARSVVTLYGDNGATALGTVTASDSGTWALGTGSLAAGVHTLVARTVDVAGNTSAASGGLVVTIDRTADAPTGLALASGSDTGLAGDAITSVLAPTVTGTAEAGGIVSLYNGSNLVGTATVAGDGRWSVTTSALGNGTHSLTARLVDIVGNTSNASSVFAVTIDASAPDAPGGLSIDPADDSGVRDDVTNIATQTISGTAEAGATVILYDGATALGTQVATGGIWTIATGPLAEGAHTLTARAIDVAGNTGAASAALTVTIDLSTPAPSAMALTAASDTGYSATDRLTNSTTLSLTGSAEANSAVTLYDNNGGSLTPLATLVADGAGVWSYTGSGFAEGVHTLTATAVDPSGNTSSGAGTLVVTVDLTVEAPGAPVLATASDTGTQGDGLTRLLAPTFTGTVESGAVVSLYDGGNFVGMGTADGAGVYAIETPLSNGLHTLTARVVDAAGNATAAASAPLIITIDAVAPDAPSAPLLEAASDSGAPGDNLTSNATPTVTGTAEALSTVHLYKGGVSVGTATADGSGAWTITASSLSDGVNTLTVRAVDDAGNTSSASGQLLLTIDTTPPTPGGFALTAATDSGRVGNDAVTAVTAPVITGTAEAGSVVTLYYPDGTTVLGNATADSLGQWSVASPTLGEGLYTLSAHAVDPAGNTAVVAAALILNIDLTVLPSSAPSLTAGSDTGLAGDRLTRITTPTVSGSAEAHSVITLYAGAALVGTGTADGSGNWSVTTGTLINGTHTLVAHVTDLAGNSTAAASAPLIITIDTENLILSDLALAAGDDTGESDRDRLTKLATPTIVGTAESFSVVTLYDGNTSVGTATAGANGAFSLTTNALSQGEHSLTALSVDRAGNTSTVSSGIVLSIDLTTPQPSLLMAAASDSGVSNSDRLTNHQILPLSGTAEANSTVVLYNGATAFGTVLADSLGGWSLLSPSLAPGSHSLTAEATDRAGNRSTSAALVVTIDIVADVPSLELLAASDSGVTGDRKTNDSTPDITGTTEAGGFVSLYEGSTLRGTATADGAGLWTITSSQMGNGAHTLTARGTDAAGNTSALSSAIVITIDTVAPNAPTGVTLASASDSGSSNTDRVTNVTAPTLSGTAEANSTVTLYSGATAVGTATANGTGAWTITAASLADGVNTLTAKAVDDAGNTSAASSPLTVTIDTVQAAPGTPVLGAAYDSGSSSTDGITNIVNPTITGTGEAGSVVTLYDGGTSFGSTTVNGLGVWSIATGTLLPGTRTLTARAVDAAGNSSAASAGLVITIDTTAAAPGTPSLAVDSGVSGTDRLINTGSPTLVGTAEANGLVRLYDGASLVGSGTADGSGAWTITASGLGTGAHTLSARMVDAAGNTSAASATLTITVDTTAPGAPGTPSLGAGSNSGSTADSITSVFAPTITGTAEANSLVTLYDGATALGTVTADGGGVWSVTTPSLADGAHTLSAVALDPAGNTSAASAPLTVTIDTTAAAPTGLALATVSDTGLVGDNLTSATTPTITGRAEAGSTVTLLEGTTVLGTATADSAGVWSITSSVLTGGTGTAHSLIATMVDLAGNTSGASAALTFTIDTVPDDVSIELAQASDTGSSNSDRITSDTRPTLTGTVGTVSAGAGQTVIITSAFNGGTAEAFGTVVADAATGAWSFTPSGSLAAGVYNFGITSFDNAGNPGVGGVTVTIDLTADVPGGLDLATASDSGRGTADDKTNVTTPTITGTAEAGSTVTLYDNGASIGTVTANGLGAWSFTTPTLGDGTHSFTARAVDVVYNTSGLSAALVVTIATQADAPGNLELATDSGSSATDRLTNVASPTIRGTAGASNTVMLYDGSALVGMSTAGLDGNWTVQAIGLADGERTLTATTIDLFGNTSAASAALLVTIDTAAPQPSSLVLTAGSNSGSTGDLVTNDATPVLTGTAEAGSVVTLYDGATLLNTTTSDGSGAWTMSSPSLSEGAHSLTVIARDAAGNTGAASAPLVITIDLTSATPSGLGLGTGSDSGALTSDRVTNVATPTVLGVAEANSVVTLHDDVSGLNIGTATADGSGIWSIGVASTLADGTHSLTATAIDVAGNTSAGGVLVVTIDTVAAVPTALELTPDSDLGRSNSDRLTSDSTPTVRGSAEANSVITLYDGDVFVGVGTAGGDGLWSVTAGALTEGVHTLTARATDVAGNTSEASGGLVVTIDLTTAVRSIMRASGSAEANSVVTLYEGVNLAGEGINFFGSVTADSNGLWTLTASDLGVGDLTLTAVAPGAYSTAGAFSAPLVTIDLVTPVRSMLLAPDSDTGAARDDLLTNDTTPTLVGMVEADSVVTLYDGVLAVGTTTADANGAWTITSATLNTGLRQLSVTTVDKAGNTATSASGLAITIDTTAPSAPGAPALSPDSNSGRLDNLVTNVRQPVLTGSAEANAHILLYANGTLVGETDADASGNWSGGTSTLGLGSQIMTIKAVDAAGNTSSASSGLTLTITPESTAPTGMGLAPASDSGVAGDRLTNLRTPTITGSAVADSVVTLYDFITVVGTGTADGSGLWSITTGSLGGSSYTFTATALDPDGVESPLSAPFIFSIDTTAPTAPTGLDLANDDDTLTNNARPPITGTAEAGSTVQLYDGATLVGSATVDGSGLWTVSPSSALSDAAHSLTVRAVDAAGNTSAASSLLIVTVDTVATAPGALDLTTDSGTSGTDNLTNVATPTITGTADAGDKVVLYAGATAVGTAVAGGGGLWTIAASTLSDAVHTLTAMAFDAAGNTSAASAGLVVTIDTVAAPPTGLGLANEAGTRTRNTTPTVTGTAEAGSTVVLYEGAVSLGTVTADSTTGAWSLSAGLLSEGAHTLGATALDLAGNSSSASSPLIVTVDTVAPTLLATSSVNGNRLTLTFAEAMSLAASPHRTTGMSVMVDGAPLAIIAAFGTGTSTVTLTLASAVSVGQVVTFSYDPTLTGSALSDEAGNEMASLVGQAIINATPAPPSPPPPPPPAPTTVVDGAQLTVTTGTDSVGRPTESVVIAPITENRTDTDAKTSLADVPLAGTTANPLLEASLPVGVGLTASGATSGLTLGELAGTFSNLLGAAPLARSTVSSAGLTQVLPSSAPVTLRSVTPTVASGVAPAVPITITGLAPAGQASAVLLDARHLPAGTVVNLQNVDYALITGAVTVGGGAGSNVAIGDDASQTIILGAEDDTLRGGGGNDIIGSREGRDLLYGDDGDDLVFGGLGYDRLQGGTGNDTLLGGSGVDVARIEANFADVVLTRGPYGALTMTSATLGVDVLEEMELLRFDDRVELVNAPTSPITKSGMGLFFESDYLADNPDVAQAVAQGTFTSGLQHYQTYGAAEQRLGAVSLDEQFYLAQNQDVAAAVKRGELASGLQHYLTYGAKEGRDPNALFDEEWYRQNNADVAAALQAGTFESGYEHYEAFGWKEGRRPSSWMDTTTYLAENQDVAMAGVNPLSHFLDYGAREGRVIKAADSGLWLS